MKQTPFFEIVRLVDTDPDSMEELGTKPKYWFEFTDDTLQFPAGTEMLFKADNRGTGEDWAERIACELCNYLKIPHVEYEMAEESESGRYGVICPNCAISPNSLVLGNQLLLSKNPDYQEDFSHKY
ncbi:MAG: hypothetical protein LIQ31_11465, partial [Planctomycetes bacterium]|nr:hypothetical protein [Planctomycetota bacterium]